MTPVPTLPVTVRSIQRLRAGLVGVTIAMADGTVRQLIIPDTMATLEAVRISALAVAQLSDGSVITDHRSHRPHRRYAPRTG